MLHTTYVIWNLFSFSLFNQIGQHFCVVLAFIGYHARQDFPQYYRISISYTQSKFSYLVPIESGREGGGEVRRRNGKEKRRREGLKDTRRF
jgi:hypothetical protein